MRQRTNARDALRRKQRMSREQGAGTASVDGIGDLLNATAARAGRYLENLDDRGVGPTPDAIQGLSRLDEPFPESGTDAEAVLALLDEIGSPATLATAGPRFFGFVIGGALPAALAANWMAGAWDQNAGLVAASPIGAK